MHAKKRIQEMTKRIFGGADLKFLMATKDELRKDLVKKAPLKTVKSSILYFSAQLEDDKSNTAQKRSNLQENWK